MRTFLDCVPCFVRQAVDATGPVANDEQAAERVLRRVLAEVEKMDFHRAPPYMGRRTHQIIHEETGNPDPYAELKRRSRVRAGHISLLDIPRRRTTFTPDN
jgi:uncharacterized protein with ATP-grasp and redox domains